MFEISGKRKRQIDDWIEKGICARHKYINAVFRFIWKHTKSLLIGLVLFFFFVIGLIFSKHIRSDHK